MKQYPAWLHLLQVPLRPNVLPVMFSLIPDPSLSTVSNVYDGSTRLTVTKAIDAPDISLYHQLISRTSKPCSSTSPPLNLCICCHSCCGHPTHSDHSIYSLQKNSGVIISKSTSNFFILKYLIDYFTISQYCGSFIYSKSYLNPHYFP